MRENNKTIWDFVKELLHEHDCVIVPGFGGFVCNLEHARIDQVSHIITPPSKHVVFNQNLKTNDGLLASRMADQLKLSYADVIRMIDQSVTKTKDLLQDKKFFAVDFFGSFRLNSDANYVFLPEKSNTFLHPSFGLMPLQVNPVVSRSIKSRKIRLLKDSKEFRELRGNTRRKNAMRVLVGTFTLLLALNLFIFIKKPELKITGTTMNISAWFDSLFHSNTQPQIAIEEPKPAPVVKEETYIPAPPVPIETTDTSSIPETPQPFDILSFAKNIALAKTTNSSVAAEPIPDNGKQTIPSGSVKGSISSDSTFYIIGGVFCKQKYAMRFFHELEEKGFTPDIIVNARINCKRVSYSKFFSRKDAEQQLRTIQTSVNADAWILVQHN